MCEAFPIILCPSIQLPVILYSPDTGFPPNSISKGDQEGDLALGCPGRAVWEQALTCMQLAARGEDAHSSVALGTFSPHALHPSPESPSSLGG
jgi:hypothetical protein